MATNSTEIPKPLVSKVMLERELQKIRQESVIATRAGNFRKVAELTRAAAKVNEEIMIRGEHF